MMFFVTIKKDNLKQNDDNVLKINARMYSIKVWFHWNAYMVI